MVETHDLEPLAFVTLDVERAHGLDTFWLTCASCDERGKGKKERQSIRSQE
jgi:hypothetical protein